MTQASTITDEWLESLAFFHANGDIPGVLTLRTNGYEIKTWHYDDKRKWLLNEAFLNPVPETKADVKQLLRRIRR